MVDVGTNLAITFFGSGYDIASSFTPSCGIAALYDLLDQLA
jgi:hypothetical protein